MPRMIPALLTFALLVGACTSSEVTDGTRNRADRDATTSDSTDQNRESTDDAPLFENILQPEALEWRSPPARPRSDEPAFIHAIDTESGSEVWRLAIPVPAEPLLTLSGDQLIYSFDNRGNEEFVAAIGLDGALRWQANTEWSFHWPFYTDDELLIGIAKSRDKAVTDKHALVALDLSNGAELWQTRLSWRPERDDKGWLTGGSGAVYLARADMRITAFDIATGTRRWSTRTPGHTYGVPFHFDGLVYLGTDTALVAFDAFDGKERWAADTGGRRITSPQGVSASNVVARLKGRGREVSIAAADAETGTAAWISDSYGRSVIGSDVAVGYRPATSDDSLPQVRIWDGSDGRTVAEAGGDKALDNPGVTITDSAVYLSTTAVEDAPGRLIAVDLTTGDIAWDTVLLGQPGESAADDAAVFVITNTAGAAPRGALHAVERGTGDILWTFETEAELRTRPLLASGLVFVVSAKPPG